MQKRKTEMKTSVKRKVLYTHTHIVQEVQNKLKIGSEKKDAQYSATFFRTYTGPKETLIWMVSEAIAEGSFFHAAVGPEKSAHSHSPAVFSKDECCAIAQPQSFPYINATKSCFSN